MLNYILGKRLALEPALAQPWRIHSRVVRGALLATASLAAMLLPHPCQANDVFVTNWHQNNVLRYDSNTGAYLGVFASGGGLSQPWDMKFGPGGLLYVASQADGSVLRYNGSTGAFVDTVVSGHSGGLQRGGFIAFAPDGTLLVGDLTGGAGIVRFDSSTGAFLGTLVPNGDHGMNGTSGIEIGPDGNLYVRTVPNDDLTKYDPSTGAFLGVAVPGTSNGYHGGHGIEWDSFGRVYLSDQGNGRIAMFDPATGLFLGDAVPPGSGGLVSPTGFEFGPGGDIFTTDWYPPMGGAIRRYGAPSFGFASNFQTTNDLQGPVFLRFRPSVTEAFVTNWHQNNVLRYDSNTGAYLGVFASGGGLSQPWDMKFGPGGLLYVASQADGSVLRYNGSTGAYVDTIVPGHSGGLQRGGFIAFAPDGTLLVGDLTGGAGIVRFDSSTGAFLGTLVPNGDHGMNGTSAIAIGPDGNLYVRTVPNDDLTKYDPSTGAFLGVAVPGTSNGYHGGHGIEWDPFGRVYLSDQGNGRIAMFDPSTGLFLGDAVPPGSGGLVSPTGFEFGPGGDIFTTDWYPPMGGAIRHYGAPSFGFTSNFQTTSDLQGPVFLRFRPNIDPFAFSVVHGTHMSGAISDLWHSDDQRLVIRATAPAALSLPSIQVVITGTSPVSNPSTLTLRLETQAQLPHIGQTIEAYDYVSNAYVTVDTRVATTSDHVVELSLNDPARFVQPGTRHVSARISYRELRAAPIPGWVAGIDQAIWQAVP